MPPVKRCRQQVCLKIHSVFPVSNYAIVTNKNLVQYKIRDNDGCSFCGRNSETILHLIAECTHVKEFYMEVLEFIETIASFSYSEVDLANEVIIFNKIHPNATYISILFFLQQNSMFIDADA